MARKTADLRIGDTNYLFEQLDGRRSLALMTRLAKLLGQSAGALESDFSIDKIKARLKSAATDPDGGEDGTDEMVRIVASIVERLATNLEEDLVQRSVDDLLSCVRAGTTPLTEDYWPQHFKGSLGAMLKVLAKSVEVNYADFLGELPGLFDGLVAKAAEATGRESTQ